MCNSLLMEMIVMICECIFVLSKCVILLDIFPLRRLQLFIAQIDNELFSCREENIVDDYEVKEFRNLPHLK